MLSGEDKRKYMQLAIDQAKEAEKQGEVPIGAVVVDPDGRVLVLDITGVNLMKMLPNMQK